MNIHKDFKYLKSEILRKEPVEVIIRNIYRRLKELGEETTAYNIAKVAGVFKYSIPALKLQSVLIILQRKDGSFRQPKQQMNLVTFKKKLKIANDGVINGYIIAKKLVKGKDIKDGLKDMLNGISKANMFQQHDGDYVRYDLQDPAPGFTNLQVQIGGEKLKTSGKTSVTTVLVADEIVDLCNKSAQIGLHVAIVIKNQHGKSYNSGKKIKLKLG